MFSRIKIWSDTYLLYRLANNSHFLDSLIISKLRKFNGYDSAKFSSKIKRGSIRSEALNKLAKFSLQHTEESESLNGYNLSNGNGNGHSNGLSNGGLKKVPTFSNDFIRLTKAVAISDISSAHKELEIILALTKSSSSITNFDQAVALLEIIEPYLLESPFQQFRSHLSLQLSPSPWENITKELVEAIVIIASKFQNLEEQIELVLNKYLSIFENNSNLKLSSYFSFIGFLKALINKTTFLNTNLIKKLVLLVDGGFLNSVEKIGSESLSDEHDYNYLLAYQANGDEFSSLLFVRLIQELSTSVLKDIVKTNSQSNEISLIDYLLEVTAADYDGEVDNKSVLDAVKTSLSYKLDLLESLVKNSLLQVNELDQGSGYINISSFERIKLALHTKSLAYQVIGTGLLVDLVSPDTVLNLVRNSLSHTHEIADEHLAPVIISLGSLLCYRDGKVISGQLINSFPLIISNSSTRVNNERFIQRISQSLALGLKPLNQDSIVTTIYSLVNLLAVDNEGAPVAAIRDLKLRSARGTFNSLDAAARPSRANTLQSLRGQGSTSSVNIQSKPNVNDQIIFKNAIESVIEIAKKYDDPSILVLTVTVLSQKFQKVSKQLDYQLLHGLAGIAPSLSKKEFLIMMKMFDSGINSANETNDHSFVSAIVNARINISKKLSKDIENPLYNVYLYELLNNVVSRGDIQTGDHHRPHGEIAEVAKEISNFFKPIAALLPKNKALDLKDDIELVNSFKNFWFNLVVHGFSESSTLTEEHKKELEIIALSTPPLASELPRLHTETSFELNAVLRRGSSNHNVKDQKHIIGGISNTNPLELRTLSYSKLMFLSATSLLENLRVNSGDCSTVLYYFSDPSIVKTNIEKFIGSIAISVVSKFIKLTGKGGNHHFSSDSVAEQLTKILILTCHRNYDLQDAAFQSANLFLNKLPSSLCHHQSLYTLLDLLTLLFDSIVDSDTNKYEPQRQFFLKHSKVKVTLSDSYKWRRSTLEQLHKKAKEWTLLSLTKSSQDMKSLLQAYITDLGVFKRLNSVEFGVSFAVEVAGTILPTDLELSNIPSTTFEKPDTIAGFLSQYSWRSRNIAEKASIVPIKDLRNNKDEELKRLRQKIAIGEAVTEQELLNVLDLIASLLILRQPDEDTARLVFELVSIPFNVFTSDSMKVATTVWLSIIKERQDLSFLLLSEIAVCWEDSIKRRRGLYSKEFDLLDEGFLKMTYSPSDKQRIKYHSNLVSESLQTHLHVIKLFSSHFQGTLYQSDHLLKIFTRAVTTGLEHLNVASLHPFARLIRNELIKLGFDVLHVHIKIQSAFVISLTNSILQGILSWFVKKNHYPYGGNYLKIKADLNLLVEIYHLVKNIPSGSTSELIELRKHLSLIFLRDEISKILVFLNPVDPVEFKVDSLKPDSKILQFAYQESPILGISLADRLPSLEKTLLELVAANPAKVLPYHEGVPFLLKIPRASKYLILAQPISPTDSINLFQPPFFEDPSIIQYNMRSLESHDVNLTFFYVPQIVQSLRNDPLGYVGRFVVETGKTDQLFAHQIIWNMLANSYKDEDSTIEDSIKPKLDLIMGKMIDAFPEEDLIFYETEFKFFNEVTDISGKLKPYIKKTKAEKKVKIDEEMAKIEVLENVYLPSNPDGVVVDINRSSGKPLQSHAKAPFMATFKIKKSEEYNGQMITYDKWQSAIFKVGDDCRQDVLALQLISIFKSIWENSGLDLYCFPYRVTATAPGCGVIDVLPNSISRDMLGREAVNGLYEYFISKFGNENSVEFEEARNNFIKSLAAYSIISYLLQFKDRHNGNIMYDDKGHILHIDFGFCFDIVPGGVKFEAVPFKLTKEMVKVMGGSNETESFKMFEELFIKGFLAVRPFYELIVGNVIPMLDSGLPCFKGEKTIRNLKNRFYLHKSDKEVIGTLKGLIRSSYESMFTTGYDRFQKMTNGIPY
ncbi:phosphatidylinositol 4-kinase [Wickerhamomyces ciferrii]|uniref:1-phosphatidylinositol 4-kinase n=1 Tax=Wickerhamomyces ciferrii (strain ATCC 14091 / BCRC 22168 / CBS 111 / JCM 3599 / NBRC 0793 / NRRL Y-1031 F-60-10) TaxID=1206466 RepID=K0KJ37_WICCF|nr:phosphatidylinositol 4-kinase [Wickerhamomyces ciferrii]CCH41494.1 phosphatidylinositol 4-kinase [Wickerhamomyces ciferrii]